VKTKLGNGETFSFDRAVYTFNTDATSVLSILDQHFAV
jgi:hypothetical protein